MCCQEGERCGADHERVRLRGRSERQCTFQRSALCRHESVERSGRRPQDVGKRRVADFRLRLDTPRLDETHSRGRCARNRAQDRRLAHSRLSADEQRRAMARHRLAQNATEPRELPLPSEDRRCRTQLRGAGPSVRRHATSVGRCEARY